MLNKLTHIRAALRLLLFVVGTLALVPLQIIWMLPELVANYYPKRQSPIVRLWYRYVLWIAGIDVTVVNRRNLSKKQKIILSNHISYIDILVLGAYFDCFFVAKMDIAGWPIFGFLAKVGGTVFITRQRQHVKKQLDLLQSHVVSGQSLLIFPEGSTSNGREVMPFKSSLLNCAYNVEKRPVFQPVSLIYTHMNGEKLENAADYDKVAWYGDMTLAPHLWEAFRQKGFKAKVVVHHQVAASDEINPKQAAEQMHITVKESFLANLQYVPAHGDIAPE